ncbi:MAG: hypothetical protein ACJAVO_002464 [Parvibaculaceae bacterium]|jgi:hypothetical protein
MPKASLFRALIAALIISAAAVAVLWVVENPSDMNDQAAVMPEDPKPYLETKESKASLATLIIDGRVKADDTLLQKLLADGRQKMAAHIKSAEETWTLMGPGSQRQLGFEIEWSVAYESDRLISLHESIYDNGGGAHPNSYLNSLLWDKQKSAEVGLSDLLADASDNSAALKMLSADLLGQWKAEYKQRSNSDEIDSYGLNWAQKALAPKAANFETFILIAKEGAVGAPATGMMFQYAPYDLSAYALGSFSFTVPSSALQPYIADKWKDQFQ